MKHAVMLTALLLVLVQIAPPPANADDLPAEIKLELGADPAASLEMTVLHSAERGDEIRVGDEREVAHELVAVHFASLGQGRSLWRLQFTEPWEQRGDVALILYIDADNDPDTGRQGGGVHGTDIMLRPDTLSIHDYPASVHHVAAAHGDSLYFTLEAPLNIEDGEILARAYVLIQNRENTADSCRTPWFEVRAPALDTEPFAVAEDHPLYRPPEIIEHVNVRVPVDDGGTRAIVTWITSWPTESVVQWGEPGNLEALVSGDRPAQNHRLVIEDLQPDRTYHARIRARGGLGELISSDEHSFSTAVAEPTGSADRESLPLTISAPPGAAQPVTGGMPFPRGVLGSADNIRLLDSAGNELPLQAQVTVRWPDDTVKWVLLDFQADVPEGGEASYALEFGNEVTRAPLTEAISIEEDDDAIVVDTGPLRVRLDRANFALLGEAWLDGERITEAAGAGIFLTDLDGEQFTSLGAPDELYVSREGPLSATVTARGRHLSEANEPLFAWKVAMQFYAGQPLVRLLHVFENDMVEREDEFTTVRSLDLRLPLAGGQQGGRLLLPEDAAADLPAGASSRLLQGYDDSIRLEGIEAEIGENQRAPGAMALQGGSGAISLAVTDFWQHYPKSLGADAQGAVVGIMPALPAEDYAEFDDEVLFHRLWYYLDGGVYRYRLGMSKAHELMVRFHPGAVGDDEVRALSDLSAVRPLIIAPPEWYARTKAFGDITPRTEGEFEQYEWFVDEILARFVSQREDRREYGMMNYGDWWGERGYNWGNIEYDTQHGMFMQFARTGNRDFFDNAAIAARHNTDVDIVQHAHNPDHVGRPYTHVMYHVGNYFPDYDGPSATLTRGAPDGGGHTWTRGNLEFAALTGDERALRIALNTSGFLAGPLMTGYRMPKGAERASAWQLYGVLAAYDFTADEHYLNAARIITRDVMREQNLEEGHWNIRAGYSDVVPTPIGGYAWCAGLLMTALEWANRHLEDPEIDETIVRAARWLARTEWIPEAKGFRSASCDSLTPGARPGSNSRRTPAAMLRAYELTGEEQFRDIAHIGFSYAARSPAGGKGGSTQLTLSPHIIYKLKQAGITSLDTAQWEAEASLRAPGFVPVEAGGAIALPVTVTSHRDDPLRVNVRIDDLPQGWAQVEARTIDLTPRGSETISLDLTAPDDLAPGDTVVLTVCSEAEDGEAVRQNVLLARPAEVAVGDAIGLVPGEPEFLAPALEQAGIDARSIESLDDLSAYSAIFLSTQAHHVDSAGLQSDYPLLLQWVHGGGTLVISQMQDVGWRPEYLPGTVLLSDDRTESGEIAAPDHPIFAGISDRDALSGMVMYDSIVKAEGWRVLLEDGRGGPAIITTDLGEGRILAFMPSVERYLTGEAECSDPDRLAAYGRLFTNILAWALAGAGDL